MSSSNSPKGSNDFNMRFSSDEDVRRPRRSTANRQTFVESGTDDEAGPSSRRRKAKASRNGKKPPAKRARRDTDSSDSDDDKDMSMKNLTEKERELQIFKHIEHQELLKTRKEIQQKLMGEVDEDDHKPKKKKQKPLSPVVRSDKESGEESSSDDEAPKKKNSSPSLRKIARDESDEDEKQDSDESEVELDTEYHRPSEIAKKMDKKNAIAELVKSRKEKKQNEEKKRDQVLDVDKIFGGSKEEKSDSDDSSSSESSASDSEESDNDGDNSKPQGEEVNSFEQLNRIRLSRFKLAKLCHAPFFDKTVLGCFVRIGVGQTNGISVYRAAQIVGVVESQKTYNIEATRTNKALRLKHGPDERVYRLEYVSNQEITNNEYFKWRDSMKRARLPLPTTDYIDKKYNDIVAALNYQFTDDDVKKMVEQRQKFVHVRTNYASQKAQLLKMKLDADQSNDIEKSNELQREIDKIDDIIKKKELERCHDSIGITAINQRNRDAMQKALTDKTIRISVVDKDDDPFTRKSGKTRVVSGRVNKKDDEANGIKIQDKGKISQLKSSSIGGLTHSSSAPQLHKFDPSLILSEMPQSKPDAISQVSNQPSAPKTGISFAEFRRRKAEAAAAAGK